MGGKERGEEKKDSERDIIDKNKEWKRKESHICMNVLVIFALSGLIK